LKNDIETHNVNVQKHQETVDGHEQDVQRLASENTDQKSLFKVQMNDLENKKNEFLVTFIIFKNKN
jgi:hypothetical protein